MTGVRMTEEQYAAILARRNNAPSLTQMRDNPQEKKPRQKYGNHKVEVAGEKFDSKAEHKRFVYLEDLQRNGKIKDLQRQVPFELIPGQTRPSGGNERPVRYIADFVYTQDGARIVEDVKGHATPEYKLKKKLLLWVHGIELKEIKS